MRSTLQHWDEWYEEEYPQTAAEADTPATRRTEGAVTDSNTRSVDPLGQRAGGCGGAPTISGHVSAPPDWRPRSKESDKVYLPQYPTAASLRAWKTELYARTQAASARTDHLTTTWLKKAEDEELTMEDLASVPRELFALDAKTQASLLAIC